MANITFKYLERVNSKGRDYWYYRRHGSRLRIEGQPGSTMFSAAYQKIHSAYEKQAPEGRGPLIPGSVAALVKAYKSSPDFLQLKEKTRKDYARKLDRFAEDKGNLPVARMERKHVIKYRDTFADTPRTANFMVQLIRLLLRWGLDRGWVKLNPALKIRPLKTGGQHRPWEDWEIAAFRNTWSLGTLERAGFELLLNTGQRTGDVVAMTRQQLSNGMVVLTQQKTGRRLALPQTGALKAALVPWLKTHQSIAILVGKKGKPMGVDSFRHIMKDAREKADLPEDARLHGLRYTSATILRESGCDLSTIQAVTGHRTESMARRYSEQQRLATDGLARLEKHLSDDSEEDDDITIARNKP